MGLVREVLDALAMPVIETPGFEADGIIATLATQARDRGDDVIVVTGGRDSYQLVEDARYDLGELLLRYAGRELPDTGVPEASSISMAGSDGGPGAR